MVYPIEPKIAHVEGDVAVQFDYLIAGRSQTFVVTRQALEDHFGLEPTGVSPQQRDVAIAEAFRKGWERIRNVAARIQRTSIGGHHYVVLRAEDF
nr:DUF1488 family protein [uncultured Cupriavidus sp.]